MTTQVICIDRFDPARAGYPVRLYELTAPPAPDAPDDAPAPIAEALIPQSLILPGGAGGFNQQEMIAIFQQAGAPSDDLERIGAQLYALLSQDPLGAHLRAAHGGTRVVLDVRDDDLRELPWELLNDNHLFLFADTHRTFYRGSLDKQQLLPRHDWPLRVLVVVAAPEAATALDDQSGVNGEHELELIRDALLPCDADVDLFVLKCPTIADVVRYLRTDFKPHIFHFIGHGGTSGNGTPSLWFYDKLHATNVTWEPLQIRNQLAGESALRLVFLNACRSVANDPLQLGDHSQQLWSIADAFLDAGVPAVLGMRSDVFDDDAARFAGGLYRSLAGGTSLDAAVADARHAVFLGRPDAIKRREWASPCLQARCAPESLVRIGDGIDVEQRHLVRMTPKLRDVRQLVDRRVERWQAWGAFQQPAQNNMLVIVGDNSVGKTSFAYMLMERCTLRRHDLRYIDMRGRIDADGIERADILTLLRAIRDGDGKDNGPQITQPLRLEAFAPFNRAVNELTQATIPPDGSLDSDQMRPMPAAAYRKLDQPTRSGSPPLFDVFRECIRQAIGVSSLVLVLDHLDSMMPNHFDAYVKPLLLNLSTRRPGDQPNITIVLLLRTTGYSDFAMRDIEPNFYRVRVSSFGPTDWQELAMDYFRRLMSQLDLRTDEDRQQWLEGVFGMVSKIPSSRIDPMWNPELLERLKAVVV